MSKFFIPDIEDANEAEVLWQAIRERMTQHGYVTVDNSRFYSISYTQDGARYLDVVGQPSGIAGDKVLAILDAGGVFLVCTASRGVLRGMPIMVGKHWDTGATAFAAK